MKAAKIDRRAWFFAFFFASGFASLVYEVVWLAWRWRSSA
jgi:hypothetical protein